MTCGMGQFTCNTLGRLETAPGYPFLRLINPTDFDFAFQNMRVRIKDTSSYFKGWDYLGMFGGQLKQFLTAYIETASKRNQSYNPKDRDIWIKSLLEEYPGRFEKDNLEKYFDTLYALHDEGQVKDSIFKPFDYTPEKPTLPTIQQSIKSTRNTVATTVILGIAAYAFATQGYKWFKKGR